jgi:hypothetical protein
VCIVVTHEHNYTAYYSPWIQLRPIWYPRTPSITRYLPNKYIFKENAHIVTSEAMRQLDAIAAKQMEISILNDLIWVSMDTEWT